MNPNEWEAARKAFAQMASGGLLTHWQKGQKALIESLAGGQVLTDWQKGQKALIESLAGGQVLTDWQKGQKALIESLAGGQVLTDWQNNQKSLAALAGSLKSFQDSITTTLDHASVPRGLADLHEFVGSELYNEIESSIEEWISGVEIESMSEPPSDPTNTGSQSLTRGVILSAIFAAALAISLISQADSTTRQLIASTRGTSLWLIAIVMFLLAKDKD